MSRPARCPLSRTSDPRTGTCPSQSRPSLSFIPRLRLSCRSGLLQTEELLPAPARLNRIEPLRDGPGLALTRPDGAPGPGSAPRQSGHAQRRSPPTGVPGAASRVRGGATRPQGAWPPARAGKGPASHARAQLAAARSTLGAGMAAAAGSGTPREEEGPSGEAAAPQPQAPTSAPGARLSRLPLARVKALVKADPDVTLAGQEAIFILARAAELFVETIAKDAYCCAQQGKRKTLQRRDLDNAIEAVDEFAFLEDCLEQPWWKY
uniref:DNA polymerase epsilon subunit 4 n=1 Tax=Canis lupus familiaris TaxID=9615 RepID=A0A8P0PS93_CANLF